MGRLGDEAKGTETVMRGLEVILRFRRSFCRAHDIFSVVAATINLAKNLYSESSALEVLLFFFQRTKCDKCDIFDDFPISLETLIVD